jgi:hypothetical protein
MEVCRANFGVYLVARNHGFNATANRGPVVPIETLAVTKTVASTYGTSVALLNLLATTPWEI